MMLSSAEEIVQKMGLAKKAELAKY
jgi:hypothetical protein